MPGLAQPIHGLAQLRGGHHGRVVGRADADRVQHRGPAAAARTPTRPRPSTASRRSSGRCPSPGRGRSRQPAALVSASGRSHCETSAASTIRSPTRGSGNPATPRRSRPITDRLITQRASRVGEPGAVVADLGQYSGAGQRGEPGHARDDRRVRMLGEGWGVSSRSGGRSSCQNATALDRAKGPHPRPPGLAQGDRRHPPRPADPLLVPARPGDPGKPRLTWADASSILLVVPRRLPSSGTRSGKNLARARRPAARVAPGPGDRPDLDDREIATGVVRPRSAPGRGGQQAEAHLRRRCRRPRPRSATGAHSAGVAAGAGRHRRVHVTRSVSPGLASTGAAPSYSWISPRTTDGVRFAAGRDPGRG